MKRPFFVDIVDTYNQLFINDVISGIPVGTIEYMAINYSTIVQCGSMLHNNVGLTFSTEDLNQYLSYYVGL